MTWKCIGPTPHIAITYGHGVFVGAGAADPTSTNDHFWWSSDGVTWQQVIKAPFNTDITAVADGFVAIGGSEHFSPPTDVLTSPDGESWTAQNNPFAHVEVDQLSSDGNRAVVIEDADNPDTRDPGAIWVSSTDGTTWTRYQLPVRDGDYADSVAILGNRIVVTGSSYNNGNSDGSGVIWTAEIP